MANTLFPLWKQTLLASLLAGTVKAQLVDLGAYTYSASHKFLSSIPVAARYGTPATLLNKTIVNGVFDADDTLFTSVPAGSGTADKEEAIVIFRDTGDPATSDLVCFIDNAAGLPVTPDGGNIVVAWAAAGIFAL